MSFEEGRYIMENKILETLFISEEHFKKDDVQQHQKKLEVLISKLHDELKEVSR